MAVKTETKKVAGTKKVTGTKKATGVKKAAALRETGTKGAAASASKKSGNGERAQTLVIVESPAKAKTIEKYLGPFYKVKASMGHLIDLPKSRMAIDVENNFEPEYIIVRGRAKILRELQSDAKKSALVMLASDNDREGEAIAWHLRNAIKAKDENIPVSRISFNEITPAAIKAAIANPKEIDNAKVDAQKARRVLDRLVGYNLSPLLWKKVKNGLSAGRVQSVALRLICEREAELEAFTPEEYWTLDADFSVLSGEEAQEKGGAKKGAKSAGKAGAVFRAALVLWKGEKPDLKKESDVQAVIDAIKDSGFTVSTVRRTEKTVRPRPPFTTSALQQTAANRLGFTSKKTMQIAQHLYEGVNIGRSRIGLITYMRTDSVRISETALKDVRLWLSQEFPEDVPEKPNYYSVGSGAQDAHEAIRPTYTKYTPESLKKYLTRDELRLYSIIWERFVSSQMKDAKTLTLSADITNTGISGSDITGGEAVFRVSGTNFIEKGFHKALVILAPKEDRTAFFPAIKENDRLAAKDFKNEQHWTQGPARYTDASIIKTLEEKGIGRPSTYAPTITLLLERYYVQRTNKQLVPTTLGRLICNVLVTNFSNVVDADFTASMESLLDEVEEKHSDWRSMIGDFYTPFKKRVDEAAETLGSYKGTLEEPTGGVCEKCGKPMVKKLGRYGYFLACSGFPACRNAKSIPLGKCPKCGSDIVERKSKGRGKKFYGCVNYPECEFLSHFKPLEQNCPKCGWFLVEKYDKRSGTHKSCINPDCDYLHSAGD